MHHLGAFVSILWEGLLGQALLYLIPDSQQCSLAGDLRQLRKHHKKLSVSLGVIIATSVTRSSLRFACITHALHIETLHQGSLYALSACSSAQSTLTAVDGLEQQLLTLDSPCQTCHCIQSS